MAITRGTAALLHFGALVLIALLVAACGGGSAAKDGLTSAPTSGDGVIVDLKDFAFMPQQLNVKAGTTVTFINRDHVPHNVVQTSVADVNDRTIGFESPLIKSGKAWSYTFEQPGEYPILCTVGGHYILGMVGSVVVE